jgi:hypothetical protein
MTGTWLALAALGAGHGLNPGMGWLFAVALGHALAVGSAVATATALGRWLSTEALEWIVGGLLLTLGTLRLVRHGHPRYGGMRVGFRELTTWSLLMGTAHGAGLMVLPLLVGAIATGPELSGNHAMHLARASMVPASGQWDIALWATAMHAAGYLVVTGLIAVVVHRKLGLRMLRTLWFNLDLIWGGALVLTGVLTLAL